MSRSSQSLLLFLTLLFVQASWGYSAIAQPAAADPKEAPYQFAVAKLLAQEGKYNEALAAFGRAAALEPNDAFIRIEYAALLLRLGQFARAETEAVAAHDLEPANLDALKILGRVRLALAERRSGSLESAMEVFEEIRTLTPWDIQSMATLGEIYLSLGRSAEAADVFRELWTHRPNQRMVYSFLVDSLMRSGQADEAEEVLREILEVHPDYLRGRLSLAEILAERGDHDGAVAVLQAAPPALATDLDLLRQLAMELFRSGDAERALEHLDAVLLQQPEARGPRYLKALALMELGRDRAAEDELRKLMLEAPELDMGFHLSRLLERQGRHEEAKRVLAELASDLDRLDRNSEAGQARVQLSYLLARHRDWQGVIEVTDPLMGGGEAQNDLEVALMRAEALDQLDRQGQALKVLARIGDDLPDARLARAKEAEILLSMGRNREAARGLAKVAEDGEIRSLLLAAEVYQNAERYDDAIPFLERARETGEEPVQVQFWLGAAYERAGRTVEAAEVFQALLEIDPEFAPALNYLGYMWADLGENLEEALDLVERAVRLEPENGAYLDSLGWAHFQLGDFDEARGHLERASELVAEDAVVFEHLGDLYMALGELDQAREVYERALELNAENRGLLEDKLKLLKGDS